MAPLQYLRNRTRYALGGALERLARVGPSKTVGRTSLWEVDHAQSSSLALAHPDLPGLWLVPSAVSPAGVRAIREMAAWALHSPPTDRSTGVHARLGAAERELSRLMALHQMRDGVDDVHVGEQLSALQRELAQLRGRAAAEPAPHPPTRGAGGWEWFEYDPGRFLAPMHASADGGVPRDTLTPHVRSFEVFDRADPSVWLQLDHLCESAPTQDGARVLRELQRRLPQILGPTSDRSLAHSAAPQAPALPHGSRCTFLQLQLLERGARIDAHVDAPSPPADVVATLTLGEGKLDSVRVGHVVIPLRPGDLYLISHGARWDVEHEVHTSMSDRLSVTFRYVHSVDAP